MTKQLQIIAAVAVAAALFAPGALAASPRVDVSASPSVDVYATPSVDVYVAPHDVYVAPRMSMSPEDVYVAPKDVYVARRTCTSLPRTSVRTSTSRPGRIKHRSRMIHRGY